MRHNEVILDREAIRHSIRARKGVDRALLEVELAREYGLTPEEVVAVLLELEAEERHEAQTAGTQAGQTQTEGRAPAKPNNRPKTRKAHPA